MARLYSYTIQLYYKIIVTQINQALRSLKAPTAKYQDAPVNGGICILDKFLQMGIQTTIQELADVRDPSSNPYAYFLRAVG
jgi:hypothetical protein